MPLQSLQLHMELHDADSELINRLTKGVNGDIDWKPVSNNHLRVHHHNINDNTTDTSKPVINGK